MHRTLVHLIVKYADEAIIDENLVGSQNDDPFLAQRSILHLLDFSSKFSDHSKLVARTNTNAIGKTGAILCAK
jgi:hypothetical protein